MENVRPHAERVVVGPVQQCMPQAEEPSRIEEAVAVDDQHPRRGSDVRLEVAMGVAGVGRPPDDEMAELG